MDNTMIAWAAGLMDGEGTFCISKDRAGYKAQVRLGMCHREGVERFAQIVGHGNVSEEPNPGKLAKYRQYRWGVSGAKAMEVTKLLRPYLIVKAAEADLLLLWEPLIANGRDILLDDSIRAKREDLYYALRAAKFAQLVPV